MKYFLLLLFTLNLSACGSCTKEETPITQKVFCTKSSDCPSKYGCYINTGLCVLRTASCVQESDTNLVPADDGKKCVLESSNDAICLKGDCVKSKCGDAFHNNLSEKCDDGNINSGDGCNKDCEIEKGYLCTTNDSAISTCVSTLCGNGKINTEDNEECDDGNLNNGDGCSEECQNEDPLRWTCEENLACTGCGDGIIQDEDEECDDGNFLKNDGCSDDCEIEVEKDWQCINEIGKSPASTCYKCGDMNIFAGIEQCDDGNDSNQDACLDTCELATCGDLYTNITAETCDLGEDNSRLGVCSLACTESKCGDGIIQENEVCDLGPNNYTLNTFVKDRINTLCSNTNCDNQEGDNAERQILNTFLQDKCIKGHPTVCGPSIISLAGCLDSNLGEDNIANLEFPYNKCIMNAIETASENSILFLPKGKYTGNLLLGISTINSNGSAIDVNELSFLDPDETPFTNKNIILIGETDNNNIPLSIISAIGDFNTTEFLTLNKSTYEDKVVKIHLQNLRITGAPKDRANIFSNIGSSGKSLHITAHNLEIGESNGIGISIGDSSSIQIYNSLISNNKEGGFELDTDNNNTLQNSVVNSVISNNGSDDSSIGGLQLNDKSKVLFSTIINNQADITTISAGGVSTSLGESAEASGISCSVFFNSPQLSKNLLIWGNKNKENTSENSPQISNGCNIRSSVIQYAEINQSEILESNQISGADPLLQDDATLGAGSSCIDFVVPDNQLPAFDKNHLPRPHPSSFEQKTDCGAFEYFKYWE